MTAGDYLNRFEKDFELRFIRIDYIRHGILFNMKNKSYMPFLNMLSEKYKPHCADVIAIEPYGDCLLCSEQFIKSYIVDYIVGEENVQKK